MICVKAYLICDKCRIVFEDGNAESIKGCEQRNLARNQNWIYTGNKDLCPNCRAKRKDGEYIRTSGRKKRQK